MSLGSLAWEHLCLGLDGLWYLNVDFQLEWFCKYLLDLHLDIKLTCLLYWNLSIPLTRGMDIWLEFHLTQWLAWWLVLETYLCLAYHSEFHLDTHLNLQILELICIVRCWTRLLGSGMVLKRSGVGIPAVASRISAKLLVGNKYFLRTSLWRYYHI